VSARLIFFFNRVLIAVLMHILFVTFVSLFVFYLQVDIIGPKPSNSQVLTTDWCRIYWQL